MEGLAEGGEISDAKLDHGVVAECPKRYAPDGRVARSVGIQYAGALDCVQDNGSGKGSAVLTAWSGKIGRRLLRASAAGPPPRPSDLWQTAQSARNISGPLAAETSVG